MQYPAKQIKKIISGPVKIVGFSVPSSTTSLSINSALTSALTIAGDGGTSVPLIASTTSSDNGVAVTSPTNRCEIWNSTTKQKISFGSAQYEVFGRLTLVSSTYTLSFFYLDNSGSETAFTFTSTTSIDFDFIYRFNFHELPADAAVSMVTKNVNQDTKGAGSVAIIEKLTVVSLNTLSNLSTASAYPTKTKLFVNGKTEVAIGASPPITVSGNTITWNATNAGYILEATDDVTVEFYV